MGALAWMAWAQDSQDPVRVESVKLTVDPAACMGGQVMAIQLNVQTDRDQFNVKGLRADCRLVYTKSLEFEEGVRCKVSSNMCTGLTGSGVIQAGCQGTAGEPVLDRQNFSCPRSKEGTPGA